MEEKKKSIGLWKNISKAGKSYISGKDEERGEKITIFANTFKKEGTREPDYKLYRESLTKQDPTAVESRKIVSHDFYSAKPEASEDIPF